MKIIFLIPPSEAKNPTPPNLPLQKGRKQQVHFFLEKPTEIAIHASQKDLKCSGKRYKEGIELNRKVCKNTPPVTSDIPLDEGEQNKSPSTREMPERQREFLPAISRYSGVMYNAIDYSGMTHKAQEYFDSNFFILSGMYGIVSPKDMIGNYKLPIETKGLYTFWGEKITDALNSLEADFIIDLLPNSYKKMIGWKNINANILQIDFYKEAPLSSKGEGLGVRVKLTHGVKKVKGEYIKNICEKQIKDMLDFGEKIVQISENQYHLRVISK